MSTALILVGHGSHISPNTCGLVWQFVAALRHMGIADEITAAFWKESPSFHTVLDTVEAEDVVIVPVFTAQGYFTQQVIPAEMDLGGPVTRRNERTIRYARTLGEHPYMAEIVRGHVEDVLNGYGLQPEDTAAAVIGHGTKRNPNSRDATRQQAAMLRDYSLVNSVIDVYLDDTPYIPDAYNLTTEPNLIAVPFFLAEGSHTTIDVPHALGLKEGQVTAQINGRQVYYTLPIGVDDTVCRLLIELARETGLPLAKQPTDDAWAHFPVAGRTEFVDALLAQDSITIGQLTVTQSCVEPVSNTDNARRVESPSDLRSRVRENPFRPLSTSGDMPGGWFVEVETPEQAYAVVETIYPGILAQWSAARRGVFRPNTLQQVGNRQVGVFRSILDLSPEQVEMMVAQECGHCVRHPSWYLQDSMSVSEVPCKEPCNWWMTRAHEEIRI